MLALEIRNNLAPVGNNELIQPHETIPVYDPQKKEGNAFDEKVTI